MPDADRDLVERASAGDPSAFDALLERHLDGLRAYVERNIGSALSAKESASDLVQSVCREVLGEIGRFEYRGEAAFREWLHRAALRKILDRRRYYEAQKRDPGRAPVGNRPGSLSGEELATLARTLSTPSGAAILREEAERLERAFERLPEADQDLIRWTYLEGLPHADVAKRLGSTEVASRKALSRALARLSREITRRI